eukprot:TRINITY_DN6370_c0_g1_i2.p1 TRINITY_DN6370_c0_g1~~TRINITY_DN6370_c0_g1_i2.p1  ORF type:complete len:108 (+),score=5.56 TRINITY_DN6370_c0_g1_i2:184-507(+)
MTTHKAKGKASTSGECVICMLNPVDIVLDCAHAYCSECIDKWNGRGADTCPICRQESLMSDDRWVLAEAPDHHEITKTLFSLIESFKDNPEALDMANEPTDDVSGDG